MLDRTFEKYQITVKYPKKLDFTMAYVYSQGSLLKHIKKAELTEEDRKFTIEYDYNEEGYKSDLNVYHDEMRRVSYEFKNDLFEDCGVADNPKRDKCYSLAYEYGHSSGYREITIYFEDLVELIRD